MHQSSGSRPAMRLPGFAHMEKIHNFSQMDVHDKNTRSYNMSRIKGKDTQPELLVRKFLHHQGFRFRLHDKRLPGKPDIVMSKYRTVILVHGCFWHGHEGCRYFKIPSTRTQWWIDKINRTQEKDIETKSKLEDMGWKVIEIWECELRGSQQSLTLERLVKSL